MERDTGPLSAAGLAELAGATEAEVEHMVDLEILVPRDGAGPFLATDVQKVRLAKACEQAGLPMEGIASVIRSGSCRSQGAVGAAPLQRRLVPGRQTPQRRLERRVPTPQARPGPGPLEPRHVPDRGTAGAVAGREGPP